MPVTQTQVAASGQFRTKPIGDDGFFVRAWVLFLQRLEVFRQNAPQAFFELSSARASIDPTKIGINSFFYETDTKKFWVSDGKIWHLLGTAVS